MCKVWISTNGGDTYDQAPDGVQIIVEGVPFGVEDIQRAMQIGEVHVCLTKTGMAFDLFAGQGPGKVDIGCGGVAYARILTTRTVAPDIH